MQQEVSSFRHQHRPYGAQGLTTDIPIAENGALPRVATMTP